MYNEVSCSIYIIISLLLLLLINNHYSETHVTSGTFDNDYNLHPLLFYFLQHLSLYPMISKFCGFPFGMFYCCTGWV